MELQVTTVPHIFFSQSCNLTEKAYAGTFSFGFHSKTVQKWLLPTEKIVELLKSQIASLSTRSGHICWG